MLRDNVSCIVQNGDSVIIPVYKVPRREQTTIRKYLSDSQSNYEDYSPRQLAKNIYLHAHDKSRLEEDPEYNNVSLWMTIPKICRNLTFYL